MRLNSLNNLFLVSNTATQLILIIIIHSLLNTSKDNAKKNHADIQAGDLIITCTHTSQLLSISC